MGIPETANFISVDEYIEGEQLSEIRHEYIGGRAYAMSGGGGAHNAISLIGFALALVLGFSRAGAQPEPPGNGEIHLIDEVIELPEELLERYPDERPSDTVVFQGSHYRVFEDEERELSWYDKKFLCERMGGHLAVIETAEEQDFIAALANGRYLSLGATDANKEGDWRWVNEAPWELTFWEEDQPNNYGGEEHYLATYDGGRWVDVAVAGWDWWMPVGFICEWPSAGTPDP